MIKVIVPDAESGNVKNIMLCILNYGGFMLNMQDEDRTILDKIMDFICAIIAICLIYALFALVIYYT